MRIKLRLLFALLFVLPFIVCGQIKSIGIPNITNYSISEYKAGTQNWDVSQDADGFMYFANNNGVLRFDGIYWDLIELPVSTPVRSLMIDKKNQLFIGLFNDFGVLYKNENGSYSFRSLRNLVPEEYQNFAEVWRIHEVDEGIVFQAFEVMFLWDGHQVEVIQPQKRFLYSFNVNGRLLWQEREAGLQEYNSLNSQDLSWSNEFKDKEIWSVLPQTDNNLIIGTVNKGLYILSNGDVQEWETEASRFVKKNKLYSSVRINDDYLAFGSILGGMIICDNDGDIVQKLDRLSGLQNNTILSMYPDKNGNLWLGLDNGIAFVKTNSPMTYFSFTDGIGTGYCSIIYKDKLYLGTNQGLFVRPFIASGGDKNQTFELVENTAGQVWSLDVFDDQLICGHNLGAFIIEDNVGRSISSIPGVWKILKLTEESNYLIGGTYNGLFLLEKGKAGWVFSRKIKGFEESSRFLSVDKDLNIWMSHGGKGVFKIQLNEKMDSVASWRIYTSKDGLPTSEHNILLNFGDTWYISAIDGIYIYNPQDDSFNRDKNINEVFGLNERIKFVDVDDQNGLWYISENEAGLIHRNEDFTYTKITTPFKILSERFVEEFEFIYSFDRNNVFIGTNDGFAHYSASIPKTYNNSFPAYITKVELPYIDSLVIPQENDASYNFPFRKNAFRFYFTSPFYENSDQLQFSYFIENYSTDWSDWSGDVYRDINNLHENEYVFKVKARNIYGVESTEAKFAFRINPPWHRSNMAYGIYGLILVVLTFFSVWFIQKRVDKSKQLERMKHKEELEKKDSEYKQQALITEKEIIRLRNEKLEADKVFLDKELANQTMSIIQKNKFLMKLNQELNRMQSETGDNSVKTKITILKKRIDKEIDNEQQNKIFESYFDDVHKDFFNRLKAKYPQLSPKDLRLCAYIRMNISTKEIATLLNISDRGVEISRYRLRKKIELSRDVNLSTFLSNI